ncbi:MAG: hypothetical protein HYY39_01590 [Armatimonadetes bacterium]|nr:hypothetical protein [Armatimonadota bacterium]
MTMLTVTGTYERLRSLLANSNFDFHDKRSSQASHRLHAFAAKFPPQLPALFIQELSRPGDLVLDPMVGSGTTLVEAYRLSRNAVGLDIDPLAVMICEVKTTGIDPELVTSAGRDVLERASAYLSKKLPVTVFLDQYPEESRRFIDYWFAHKTQMELGAILIAVDDEPDASLRALLKLVLSSIIITKSGGVSLARDLAHSRPHKDPTKRPRDALEQFELRLDKFHRGLGELRDADSNSVVRVEIGDCRLRIPLDDGSVDLIVTSPPYANAIDYMRAHKFALVWFKRSLADLTRLRSEYIGAEKVGAFFHSALPGKVERVIRRVGSKDTRKAAVLRKYFVDMASSMGEMYRVLRSGHAAVLVVGPSTIRGLRVDTPGCLSEIANGLGYELAGIKRRKLDRNRRMMPARFRGNGQSLIEQRMHEEYVVGLIKP